jgi:hypothetical protein
MNIGRAYALVRGRMTGDRGAASEFLKGIPAAKRKEMNRQNSRARGARRVRKAYRLGEPPKRRR